MDGIRFLKQRASLFLVMLSLLIVLGAMVAPPHAFATDWRDSYQKNTGCAGAGVSANDFFAQQSDGNGECTANAYAIKPTYSYSVTGLTFYATPTDAFCIVGSATKTIRVQTFTVAHNSTSATLVTPLWIKRSAADTGGTNTTPSPVALDSGDSATTATLVSYTAAPSLGTAVGTVFTQGSTTAVATASPVILGLGTIFQSPTPQTYTKPVTLRSTAESLCLNYGGAALPSGYTAALHVQYVEY